MADPEKLLRELWDKQGVPKEEQDRIIRDIEEKAKPGPRSDLGGSNR